MDAGIIVDCTHNRLPFVATHTYSGAIKYFIKQSISNTYSSSGDVDDFKYLFVLVLYEFTSWVVESWLQVLYKINQEVSRSVLGIQHSVSAIVVLVEECSIFVKEVFEQVVNKYSALNFFRKRVHEPHVAFICYGLQPIIDPVIVEEVFDLCYQFLFERVSVIKSRQKGYPLRKILMLANFPKRFVVHQNFYKLAHNEREDSYSKHQNQRCKYTFRGTHRCKISEANCG